MRAGARVRSSRTRRYWIGEFHFDGLRLDATQQIFDASASTSCAEITRARAQPPAAGDIVVIAENEPQDTRARAPARERRLGLDALWNDDFHHAAHVALTGHDEAYYSDYRGTPQELAAARQVRLPLSGPALGWQSKRARHAVAGPRRRAAFVTFLENHDQVANSGRGPAAAAT